MTRSPAPQPDEMQDEALVGGIVYDLELRALLDAPSSSTRSDMPILLDAGCADGFWRSESSVSVPSVAKCGAESTGSRTFTQGAGGPMFVRGLRAERANPPRTSAIAGKTHAGR